MKSSTTFLTTQEYQESLKSEAFIAGMAWMGVIAIFLVVLMAFVFPQ